MIWTWSIVFHAFIITLSILGTDALSNSLQNQIAIRKEKICQRIIIKLPSDLGNLKDCNVVEGSVQITLISVPENINNLTFPNLREITGYLMLFSTDKLLSMKTLFPNLAVIRGQELIDTFAVMIMKMKDMQEIGLSSLTNVINGGVWIVDNENLCYIDTIDWTKIVNDSNIDGIYKNKQQCPDTCQNTCPSTDFKSSKHLCWSKTNCQIIHGKSCPESWNCKERPCYANGCCHVQCLGGCSGPGPNDCHVCKGVRIYNLKEEKEQCATDCPDQYYKYLDRRCLTEDECHKINVTSLTSSKEYVHGKLHTGSGKKLCVLDCPKGTELAPNQTVCIDCFESCRKSCPGRIIDSIEVARELSGCTRIIGALKIHIRKASGAVFSELKKSLDKIEEIDDFLTITYTTSISSLDFLENLKVIRGNKLDEDKYVLSVKSNENLVELWQNKNITIPKDTAKVLFHYNHQLCPNKIWEFVHRSELNISKDDKTYIGVTNGDKVPCNNKKLVLQIRQIFNSSVTIQWENFRRNLPAPSHLLNYEVHYKEAPPPRNLSKFEDRDPCGDDGWNVQEQSKIKDSDVPSSCKNKDGTTNDKIECEPEWENEKFIANLKPFTRYGVYVKAIVIPDAVNNLNNNTGGESDILYFRTLAFTPMPPRNFKLATGGPENITIRWEPPKIVNGELEYFKILIKNITEIQEFQDQKDYCKYGRAVVLAVPNRITAGDSITTTMHHNNPTPQKETGEKCCSCSGKPPKTPVGIEKVFDENAMLDILMTKVFTKNDNDDDPATNEIRKSNRRRRSVEKSENDRTSNSAESDDHLKVFPDDKSISQSGPSSSENNKDKYKLSMDTDMTLFQNVTFDSSLSEYVFTLENLTHYTTYTIGIQACRKIDPAIENLNQKDIHVCSQMNSERIQTKESPTADIIDPNTIFINITDGNRLHVRWGEPAHPNGLVMGYLIRVQKVGNENAFRAVQPECITRKAFLKRERTYDFPLSLPPGNHSLGITVASLAHNGVEVVKYFYIEDVNDSPTFFWVSIILIPIITCIILASSVLFYLLRKKDVQRIISANPEYMQNVDIPESYEVPRDKIKLLDALGTGSFGRVHKGILFQFEGKDEFLCAVKILSDDAPSENRFLFLIEAQVMTKLNCHHVIKLLGVVSKTQPTYVIMELMTEGDLKTYLKTRRPENGGIPPTMSQILRMAAEICDGMAYLHHKQLLHRDLAARNCMVHESLTVKVGDFGMTKEIMADYYRKNTRGFLPIRWMSPEAIKDGVFTNHSDVWSFGVVLWEMATLAAYPYQGLSNDQVIDYVKIGNRMEKPENCPKILWELMDFCWKFDPRQRPSFMDLLEMLEPYIEKDFEIVSFYHSSAGGEYKDKLACPNQEDTITIQVPLKATFESDLELAVDELDAYESDEDQNRSSHHIIDDLGDASSMCLLQKNSTRPLVNGNSYSALKPSIENGYPLTSLSGKSRNPSLGNGNSTLYPSIDDQPLSLLSTSIAAPSTSQSSNNYAEATFTSPSRGNDIIHSINTSKSLTPTKSSDKKPSIVSVENRETPKLNSSNIVHTNYTDVEPVGQNSGHNHIISNNSELDSNESSKLNGVNYSDGDWLKYVNGGRGSNGGNGYINQRNKPHF